jgi:hypothetical protein
MPRFFVVAAASTLALTLSGCSVFYPNWGATGIPEEPFDNSEVIDGVNEVEPEVEVSATAEPTPEATETAPEAEATPAPVAQARVNVDILMAVVEAEFGVLTVIAQVPGVAENAGSCELKFMSGGFEKTMRVKAEQSSDYTQCFPIEMPLDGLPAGNALVTVSYESERFIGRSAATSVVIP